MFLSFFSLMWRNKIIVFFILACALFRTWQNFNAESPFLNVAYFIGWLFLVLVITFITQLIVGAVMALLHTGRGVFCRHWIEIVDKGIVESTDVNQTLCQWAGLNKIVSGPLYLYIYTGGFQYFLVPRREVPSAELLAFEKELKARAAAAKR